MEKPSKSCREVTKKLRISETCAGKDKIELTEDYAPQSRQLGKRGPLSRKKKERPTKKEHHDYGRLGQTRPEVCNTQTEGYNTKHSHALRRPVAFRRTKCTTIMR